MQSTINQHREQLNNAFLHKPILSTSSFQDVTPKEIQSDETKKKEKETLNENENENKNIDEEEVLLDDPLGAIHENLKDGKEEKEEIKSTENDHGNQDNPLLVIEEALAELKLVKDALLGNLDEIQLESWLNWTFVEPSPEFNEPFSTNKKPQNPPSGPPKRRKPAPPKTSNAHRRNLSSSGLPPPKKGIRKSPKDKHTKTTTAIPQHPLD